MKVRLEDPSLFRPDLEYIFPGLSQLPTAVRNQRFLLSGEGIRSRGKALSILIGEHNIFGALYLLLKSCHIMSSFYIRRCFASRLEWKLERSFQR